MRTMEKKILINLLNEVCSPLGFKRKGNYLLLHQIELTQIINLQKSIYGNLYYINYGFKINNLNTDNNMMHIWKRLAGANKEEVRELFNALDFSYEMNLQNRLSLLREAIRNKIFGIFQKVHTESDLVEYIKKRPTMNDIPIVVKEYLGLN